MREDTTVSERIVDQGMFNSQQEYNSLKESKEREIEGTRKLYEKFKREGGHDYAIAKLRQSGYNPSLIGKQIVA
jgi:hypothetical protein